MFAGRSAHHAVQKEGLYRLDMPMDRVPPMPDSSNKKPMYHDKPTSFSRRQLMTGSAMILRGNENNGPLRSRAAINTSQKGNHQPVIGRSGGQVVTNGLLH